MNWLDVAILSMIAGSVLAAYSAGLIREVITLVGVIVGVITAGLLYDDLARDALVFVGDEDASEAVSFLVLLGAVYLFAQILAYVLKRGASLLMLGWADRAGGAVFGLIKGLIAVQVLLIVFAAYPDLALDGAVDGSALARYFIDDFSFLLPLLPANFEDRIDQFLLPGTG